MGGCSLIFLFFTGFEKGVGSNRKEMAHRITLNGRFLEEDYTY